MDPGWVEVFHRSDFFGGGWFCQDGGQGGGRIELAEGGFMAVIWFLLRDQNDVGFGNVAEILDT